MHEQGQPSFEGLGISELFMGILESLRFTVPTPIQHKAIPAALSGEDVIGIAQTGTGKTLAFGIPMLQRLSAPNSGGGLVLLPTRELAIQVDEALRTFGAPIGIRTAVLIGGESISKQIMQIRRRPNIIIATPGRLLDLVEHRAIRLEKTSVLILDEADRMLDMGFAPQINKILSMLPSPADRQTMLFSATMPDDIVRIATHHMRMPVRVEVAPAGTAAETVEQELYIVPKENKMPLLAHLLQQYHGPVLVFTRTKHGATKLARAVGQMGHRVSEIHANRSLGQRKQSLEGFKSGAYRVLIATDIAARGIDVSGIELVVNYDLPHSSDYVHRIGRTGRAGKAGKAVSFAMPDQRTEIRDIEKLIRKPLPIAKHPQLSVDLPERHVPSHQRGIGGGRVRRFGHRPRFNRR
ncbi:MAG TPA: DEAD/DEAH box helicase [Candidatus Paceibacterota bacterium]|nr:DEAD/DEAH box helicase [Candidatus Paceibacterota bacterium]